MTMVDPDKARLHRMRAVMCDQRAGQATDVELKKQWQELAMEWHALASEAARAAGDDGQIEIA
jgi:hypothetical protein